MNRDRLLINEKEVDLSSDTVIALTFQINDLAQLKDRQADFTNQFKLPKTRRNRMILGNADMVQSPTVKPYRKLPARIYKDGIEVVPAGYAIIETSDSFYNVTVYAGNVQFFDLIDGKMLGDLDLSDFAHVFNLSNIFGSAASTDFYKYPVIDAGLFVNSNRTVDLRNLRPCLFVKDLIDAIFDQAGFNKSGLVFSDARYVKLLLTTFNKIFTEYYDTDARVIFADWFTDPPTLPADWVPSTILIKDQETWNYTLRLVFNINTFPGGAFFKVSVEMPDSSGTAFIHVIYNHSAGTGTFDQTFTWTSFQGNAFSGDYLGFIELDGKSCDTEILFGEITGENNADPTQKFKLHIPGVVFNSDAFGKAGNFGIDDKIQYGYTGFTFNHLLSDILQKDLIQDIVQKYGIIFKTDPITQTLYFKKFEEIADAIPIAKDWSSKFHWEKQNHKTEYRIGYAQKNYLSYPEDSNDKDILKGTGDGYFVVDDETLDIEKDLFTVPFPATKMEKALKNLNIALICKIDPDTLEYTIQTEPRILVDDTQDITGDPIHYIDASTASDVSVNIPLCYFVLNGKPYNLGFDDSLIADNYQGLIAVLNKAKKLTLMLNLTASDIASLDHFVPVYIAAFSAYFYINKIINWTGRGLTKVELIRLQTDSANETDFKGFQLPPYELEEDGGISQEETGDPSLREHN